MAKPLIAPSTAPNSMARAVPSPCAAEPKASPLATRLLTWQRSRMAGPTIPPKSPQPNTITAVSDGMPFECSDKEIAMGMVTDLGCSDEVIASSTPHDSANSYDTYYTYDTAGKDSSKYRYLFSSDLLDLFVKGISQCNDRGS